jgi:hypothetical protein
MFYLIPSGEALALDNSVDTLGYTRWALYLPGLRLRRSNSGIKQGINGRRGTGLN